MASLREIKDRIGSVRSTLKITSAMKLVASAKLRKAQKAIEALRPYEHALAEIVAAIEPLRPGAPTCADMTGPTAIVAIASNSSLCGGFNANVIRKALEAIRSCEGEVEVYPLGRKMAEGLRRAGYTSAQDYNDLIAHPAYEKSAALARRLSERYQAGEISRVFLVYNRFISAGTQVPTTELYLPFEYEGASPESPAALKSFSGSAAPERPSAADCILEPDPATLLTRLRPQLLVLKFHAAILDSAAAEQAARTIAMQTATDNAEDLLGELTLEYNKGRQQKITAEILDLLGGAAE